MSEINVQLKGGASANIPAPATVGEALKRLDREAAKRALTARVDGRAVDLDFQLNANGDAAIEIEPIVPGTDDALFVLRHSTAHLLAAAVLDLFPGTNSASDPPCSTIRVTAFSTT